MHNSINELLQTIVQHCSVSRAASENRKRFEVVSDERFTKIKVDGGLISSHQLNKCDFAFIRHSSEDFYFVELKGSKIDVAFEQIVATINIFHNEYIKIPKNKRYGFIVGRTVPRQRTGNDILKLKFASDYGRLLKIQNPEIKYTPE